MSIYLAEDHRKFAYALVSRDIRRLTAFVHRVDINEETLAMIDNALEQLDNRAWLMSFHDPQSGNLIKDEDLYSDGRPVTTTIDWGDGFATLVHCPDLAADKTSGNRADELAEELWPGEAQSVVENDNFDDLGTDCADDVE
jgi:hypothetical protein